MKGLNKSKGRMFRSVGWTYTCFYGCTHGCPYCWAYKFAEDKDGFREPKILYSLLGKIPELPDDGSWIFLGSQSDLFCDGFYDAEIRSVFTAISAYEGSCRFLLQSKNPVRMIDFTGELLALKDKVVLGTTIETNRETPGYAPRTELRYAGLMYFTALGFDTFLSLEPLADFDHRVLADWLINLDTLLAVEVGLENYTSVLPKPPEGKIINLIKLLENYGLEYKLKDNLKHLEVEV